MNSNLKTKFQVICAFRNGRLTFKDFEGVPEEYKIKYREIALGSIAYDADRFKLVPKELQNDRSFVLEATINNGYIIQHVSEEFRNDSEIMLIAINDCPEVYEFASDELKNNYDFVRGAVYRNGMIIHQVETFCYDKDLLLAAMRTYRDAFDLADGDLQYDPELIEAHNLKTEDELMMELLGEDYEAVMESMDAEKAEYEYLFETKEDIPQDVFVWDAEVIRPYLSEECGEDDDIYQEDEPDWDSGL